MPIDENRLKSENSLSKLAGKKYLFWRDCLELLFGDSKESSDPSCERSSWEFNRRYSPPPFYPSRNYQGGAKLKTVEMKKTYWGLLGGEYNCIFLPGCVYEFLDNWANLLINDGWGTETTRQPSSKSELEEKSRDFKWKITDQYQLKQNVFEAMKREEIITSSKTDLTGKIDHWAIDTQSFLCWAKEHWDEISPLRHFLGGQSDDLREYVEYHRSADGKKKNTAVIKGVNSKRHMKSRKHKEMAREKAKAMWAKDPNRTIENIVNSPEINKAVEEQTYRETTIRDWVKDLCPNRTPGRRPKKIRKKK